MCSRFEVKVGKPFVGEIVVSVLDQPKAGRMRPTTIGLVALAMFLASVISASAIYGVLSGDFSTLRGIAEIGAELLASIAKAFAKIG